MGVISAGRRPVADVVGRCWWAALLYCAAVPLRWPRRVGLAMDRWNWRGAGAGGDAR